MRTHLRALLIVSLSSLAVGCVESGSAPPNPTGGSSGTGGSDTGGSDTGGSDTGGSDTGGSDQSAAITAFLSSMATSDCTEAFKCMSSYVPEGSGDTFAADFGSSVSDCESNYWDVSTIIADVSAGKILFDATDAASCASGITAAATCSAYWANGNTYPASCDTAVMGTVAVGGACDTDFECSDPNDYCDDTTSVCTVEPASFAPPRETPHQLLVQILRAR